MLKVFSKTTHRLQEVTPGEKIDPEGIWYDLFCPTPEETALVKETLNMHIPSQEEMQEIELSSRLYEEEGALYMTAAVIASADSENPTSSPVTFILGSKRLVTIRYSDPKPFQTFTKRAERNFKNHLSAELVFFGLLDNIIDRLADVLEMIGSETDAISREIFKKNAKNAPTQQGLHDVIVRIGKKGDLNTKIRESLENIGRLLIFLGGKNEVIQDKQYSHEAIDVLQKDVASISEHVAFLSNKVNFLLDATLGLINIEQNAIIKIFSVAAVIFLPPTMIASVYGMNFKAIPELTWEHGYPLALILMLISAVLPYLYFKHRRWL